MDDKKEDQKIVKYGELKRLIKWSFFIFVVLFVFSVSLGFSPLVVRELNNSFFSLFIHDEKVSDKIIDPNVLVTVDSKKGIISVEEKKIPVSLPKSNGEEPARIVIEKVSLDVKVLNPESTAVSVLDNSLLYGAVRYPGSGDLDSDRNVLIFGHSSGLKVIYNQNFKIFNGLKLLNAGDEVKLYSGKKEYRYRVISVRLALADEALVTFSNDHKLILSTCNTFGAKQERYVVEADFVGSYPITS